MTIQGEQHVLIEQHIEQRLQLPRDGIWVATANIIGAKMEQPKVSGKYKLSICSDVCMCNCYRWFLEFFWMHSKTYTLSIRAKTILKTAKFMTMAWAQNLKDHMCLEAQHIAT